MSHKITIFKIIVSPDRSGFVLAQEVIIILINAQHIPALKISLLGREYRFGKLLCAVRNSYIHVYNLYAIFIAGTADGRAK